MSNTFGPSGSSLSSRSESTSAYNPNAYSKFGGGSAPRPPSSAFMRARPQSPGFNQSMGQVRADRGDFLSGVQGGRVRGLPQLPANQSAANWARANPQQWATTRAQMASVRGDPRYVAWAQQHPAWTGMGGGMTKPWIPQPGQSPPFNPNYPTFPGPSGPIYAGGGYDGSGINPGGMYNQPVRGLPQLPVNQLPVNQPPNDGMIRLDPREWDGTFNNQLPPRTGKGPMETGGKLGEPRSGKLGEPTSGRKIGRGRMTGTRLPRRAVLPGPLPPPEAFLNTQSLGLPPATYRL